MMNTKDYLYSWHLSLRVDRPVENCHMRPHAYMYGKKLDSSSSSGGGGTEVAAANTGNGIVAGSNNTANGTSGAGGGAGVDTSNKPVSAASPHTKVMKEPPPQHEFSYRWFRGPLHEPCAFKACPRRTSFSPHDWSKHAFGSADCALQCISTQSSLYKCTFCNSKCFVLAWKTQYTVPKEILQQQQQQQLQQQQQNRGGNPYSAAGGAGGGGMLLNAGSRSGTPSRSRAASFDEDQDPYADEAGSTRSSGSRSPGPPLLDNLHVGGPGTPRGYLGEYNNNNNNYNVTTDYHAGDDWMEVSRDHIFIPSLDDIGRKLKLEAAAYSLETGELLMSRVVKTDVVLARAPPPPKRNFVTAKNLGGTSGSSGAGPRFRVATYNVLSEIYATAQQYPHCDFWALSWEYRFQNILREIVDAAPEVLCLQEIQADHYENHVYANLSEAGYEGVFKQKTRQSMGLAGKVDGCALFWRRSKFHLIESYSIEFNELAQRQATQVLGLNPRSEEGVAFLNRLSKDNVAQLVVLEFIPPAAAPPRGGRDATATATTQVCVANTHLYSNKDFPDVKLWQTWQLLQELESFVLSRGTSLPLIICGDFNSTPDTAVYDLLARQSVHPGHPDVNVAAVNNSGGGGGSGGTGNGGGGTSSGGGGGGTSANGGDGGGGDGTNNNATPNILPDAMNISHSFQLGSAYQTVLGEEPWVTNFTLHFKGVLDYIWYSAPNLRPLSAAPIPDEAELTKHGAALPSTEYSSDHVMLISDLQVISNGNAAAAGNAAPNTTR